VEDYLRRPGSSVDLAFVDPPYALPLPSVEEVLALLMHRLAPGAVVVVHRRTGSGVPAAPAELRMTARRSYGDAEITRWLKEDG
jgi:16S rRNA (guanine966-N2)-methyltransferase